jgi:hypothetical protein
MSKWPDTSPVLGKDGWTEHFNTHTKKFGFVAVSITYSSGSSTESPGFIIHVNDNLLKKRKMDLAEAKAYAIQIVIVLCERAMFAAKEEKRLT